MSEPMIVRSVTVAEVMGDDGQLYLLTTTEGDPAAWDQMGMLGYALEQLRGVAAEYEDDD